MDDLALAGRTRRGKDTTGRVESMKGISDRPMSESDKQGQKRDPPTDGRRTAATDTDPTTRWVGLTAFQRDLLVTIAGAEEVPYGLAIKRRLETVYRAPINHGRLYPNLDELADQGLLAKTAKDKRTNGYHLTASGEAVLRAGAERLTVRLGDSNTALTAQSSRPSGAPDE
jgi:DNA-binding PadR family transcriptional regulator